MPTDLRTKAIVLRRTNYGESDRILNLLTPEGKVAVMARGVRKSKSRLAGGIELFTVADVVIHQGRAKLSTLTSATMLRFYGGILSDVERLELAGKLLKQLDRASEQITNPEHFSLLSQTLCGLDRRIDPALVQLWFNFNLARTNGEEINLLRDIGGKTLDAAEHYLWDTNEKALCPHPKGDLGANEIKFARFMLGEPLLKVAQVQNYQTLLSPLRQIIKNLV